MPETRLQLEVITAKPSDTREPPRVQLNVMDYESNIWLCRVELTADQWWNLVTGSVTTVDGTVSKHLERVGRRMVVDKVSVPADVARFRGDESAAQAWVAEQDFGADETDTRLTNKGWEVLLFSWPSPLPTEPSPEGADE